MPVLKIKKNGVWTEVVPDAVAANTADIDKIKEDYLTSADKYTLPAAGIDLGGVKSGGDVTISNGVISVDKTKIKSISGSTGLLATALNQSANSVATYQLSGDSYTADDLPPAINGAAYKYSAATVIKRYSDNIYVILHGMYASTIWLPTQYNMYDGTNWHGWVTNIDSTNINDQTVRAIAGKLTGSIPEDNVISRSSTGNITIGNSSMDDTNYNIMYGKYLAPYADTKIDLGTSSRRFKDGYFSGTVTANRFEGTAASADTASTLSGLTSTITELNYTDGVTSNIQEQLNAKLDANLNIANGSKAGALQQTNVTIPSGEKAANASGVGATALGVDTTASSNYAFASGHSTTAKGLCSHAEGLRTEATVACAHAEGADTHATGNRSHAEGDNTTASASFTHAEGCHTVASNSYAHAEGYYTIANGQYQHAQGKYNVKDTANQFAHIVGNGDNETSRSNAHTLDWDGNAWFAGEVRVGDDNKVLATQATTLSGYGITDAYTKAEVTAAVSQVQHETPYLESKIENGVLVVSNGDGDVADCLWLRDTITRKVYKLCISDGKLYTIERE